MKKLTTLLLSLVLVLALTAPVGAAEREDATERAQTVTQLGGTAGQVNVLLGERCIAFTDAAPEIRNGRTMVPLRAALEAMGATVDYEPATRTVSVTHERAAFTHVIGSRQIVLADGATVEMDTASYLTSANRTMVPVRFFSQVLGYDVFWDSGYRLVILLDRAQWVADVDAHFTVLNAQLARTAKRGSANKAVCEEMTFSGTVAPAASDGDGEAFTAALSSRMDEGGMALELHADIGALTPLLAPEADAETAAILRVLLSSLELDALYGDRLYLRSPLLDAFAPESNAVGVWYALAETEVSALLAVQYGGTPTVGTLCYAAMTRNDTNDFYAELLAGTARARLLDALAGDGALKRSGSSYRGQLDLEGLSAAGLDSLGFTACEMHITLYRSGKTELSVSVEVEKDGKAPYALAYTATGDDTRSDAEGSLTRNGYRMEFRTETAVSTVTDAVTAAPSAGETVIDLAAG